MSKNKDSCHYCGTVEDIYMMREYKNGNKTFRCRPCNRSATKKYYDRKRELVFGHYGKKCVCCKEDTFEFLSIDHINNDGYIARLNDGSRLSGVHLYQKIVKDGFPDSFQTLCMNCNFGKRMNNGICPHNASVVI